MFHAVWKVRREKKDQAQVAAFIQAAKGA